MSTNHRKNGAPARKKQKPIDPPRRLGDDDISLAELRAQLGEMVSRVSYKHDRVVITKHGKPVAALISADDLEFFERLEDRIDAAAARRADAETRKSGGPIPWETVKRELNLRG